MTTTEETIDPKTTPAAGETAIPDRWSDSMNELADLDTPEESRATPPPKKPAKEERVEKPEKTEVKPKAEAPKKDEKAEEKSGELDETKPIKASELRAHYDRLKAERETLRAENAKLKGEVEKRSKPVEDPEKKTLTERLEKESQRAKVIEEKLRLFDYRNSEDFQSKYWKPYQDSIARATEDLEDLTFQDSKGGEQKVDNGTILWLAGLRPVQAESQIQALFGDSARLVTDRIDKVRNAARDMNQALADHQKSAAEQWKQQEDQRIEQQRRISKVWTDERKAWPERFPNMFSPKEGDEEGNALLAKGYELVEQAFSPNGKSPEDMAKIHAEIYHKAAAFPRAALNLKRARTRIKELEAIVADYENAEPPAGTGRGTKPDAKADSWDEAFNELGQLK